MPTTSSSAARAVMTATPVAKEPSAWRKARASKGDGAASLMLTCGVGKGRRELGAPGALGHKTGWGPEVNYLCFKANITIE